VRERAWRGGGVIFAFWHNVVMVPLGHEARRRTVALVSPGGDGTFAARIVRHFGVHSARGSTSQQGVSGVFSLLRDRPEGYSLVVTPDGPRGPRYRVQTGVVYLASRSGLPIVPVGMAVDRTWRLRSWDRFRIPKPFARAEMVFGSPRLVPPDVDRGNLEEERLSIEQTLHALSQEAHRRAGSTWPD
jgi:lysophospholipid acyltransferase (LPLAT)-like uncharacterized protein